MNSIDTILDHRDTDDFSNSWTNAWQKVKQHELDVDMEREEIFKLIFSKTTSSDLAAYITEDFELIAKYSTEEEHSWVTSLCGTYFENKIPQGKLKNLDVTLIELITQ